MSFLTLRHVSKSFRQGIIRRRDVPVLQDISFSVNEGEMAGLAGTSGAGKSTVLRLIMGMICADGGEILWDGQPMDKEKIRKSGSVQMLYQNPASSLNPRMTIRESFAEPLLFHRENHADLSRLLEDMQLRTELLDRYPHQLSGGELQRVCLGRLLLLRPQLLLLDEPTSMLDVSVQAQVAGIIREKQRETGMACLFISHDLDLLRKICGRIGIMKEGCLLEMEETETLYAHPRNPYTKALIEAFEDF